MPDKPGFDLCGAGEGNTGDDGVRGKSLPKRVLDVDSVLDEDYGSVRGCYRWYD